MHNDWGSQLGMYQRSSKVQTIIKLLILGSISFITVLYTLTKAHK